MPTVNAMPFLASVFAIISAIIAVTPASAACLPTPSTLVNPGALTVGTSLTAPPMGFSKDGTPAGFEVDLLSAMSEKMCLKAEFVDLTFQGLFPGLIAKKFDTVASRVGITPARKEQFDFVPYFKGGLRLVTQKTSNLRFETESDVCGHPVALVSGTTQMAALERVKKDCPAEKPMVMKTFTNQIEAMNEVAKKSVSAAYVDWPLAANLIQLRPNDFKEASPVLSGNGPGTPRNRNGFVVRKGDAETVEAITAAFNAVVADGTYDELMAKWNLTDGDVRKAND